MGARQSRAPIPPRKIEKIPISIVTGQLGAVGQTGQGSDHWLACPVGDFWMPQPEAWVAALHPPRAHWPSPVILIEAGEKRLKVYGAVALLVGEDPSHTAKNSMALAQNLGIQLIWMPKRAPELNPMETLWGQANDVISANCQYPSLAEQVAQFLSYLEGLSNAQALATAGLRSPDFWLADLLSKDFR